MAKKTLSAAAGRELLGVLGARFEKHRRFDFKWALVQARLEASPAKLWSLQEMERTGGEPDVVGYDRLADEYIFFDRSAESPAGRRNLCYDREALAARKENKPASNALEMAAAMGIELLTEEEYFYLQTLGSFDAKTSSWLRTPASVRGLGGAIFGDFRYGRVFIYHNGAQSYYAARGFRGSLRL